ncbi:MAG: hypothetical protein WAN65_29410, partial [Candidatus Sulfotelmatobacter sp.]
LHIDIPARQALETSSQQGKGVVLKWLNHYMLLRSLPKEQPLRPRSNLADTLITNGPGIGSSLTYSLIIDRHIAVRAICNSAQGVKVKQEDGSEKDRDLKSLPSKLLWLLHPDVVPIFDSQAWSAMTVVARLAGKVPTPDEQSKKDANLNEYCTFLELHQRCFGELYDAIDAIIGEEFSKIFDGAPRKNSGSITQEDAKRQYANHVTVIDQLLWHLGSEVPIEGCLTKRIRKEKTAQGHPLPLTTAEGRL